MRRLVLALCCAAPLFASASASARPARYQTSPPISADTARQLNGDRRYAHNTNGDVIMGPSRIDEVVVGHPDRAGNVHVDRPGTAPAAPIAPVCCSPVR
jgi:hypothetical protein